MEYNQIPNSQFPNNQIPNSQFNQISNSQIHNEYQRENQYADQTSFDIIFHDGYSFRHLIEYFKLLGIQTKMSISKKGIFISENSGNNKILNVVSIYGHELVRFEFKSQSDSANINIDTKLFFDHGLKSITKKKSLRIYKYVNNPYIQVQRLESIENPKDTGKQIPTLTNTEKITKYGIPPFEIDNPICTVPTEEVIDKLSLFNQCEAVVFVTSTHGVNVRGIMNGQGVRTTESFGNYKLEETNVVYPTTSYNESVVDIDNIDLGDFDFSNIGNKSNNQIITYNPNQISKVSDDGVKVSIQFIKALLKLKNISSNGTVKFYGQKKVVNDHESGLNKTVYDFIAIVFSIGSYGKLNIFIR